MFDNPFFQSAIALVTLYLVFSQLTLSLVELPAGFLNKRGEFLYKHLKAVLGQRALNAFYNDPAIQALKSPVTEQNWLLHKFAVSRWPAYVSETLFAQTLIAWVSSLAPADATSADPGAPPVAAIKRFKTGLDALLKTAENEKKAAAAAFQAAEENGATAATVAAAAQNSDNQATTAAQDAARQAVKDAATAGANPEDIKRAATEAANAVTAITTAATRAAQVVAQDARSNAARAAQAAQAAAADVSGLLLPLYTAALATAATEQEQGQALQKNLEAWSHEFGERMTGWYKRTQRWPLFWGGLLVAILADVDTVRLARYIFDSNNAKARTALVEMGVAATQKAAPVDGYNPTDAEERKRFLADTARRRTLNRLATAAVKDFQTTLAAVPKASLPLGPFRWLDHSTTVVDAKPAHKPTPPAAKDSVATAAATQQTASGPAAAANTAKKNTSTTTSTAKEDAPAASTAKKGTPTASSTAKMNDAPTQSTAASPPDSIRTYAWAASADDFGMPAYAQRWQLNKATGEISNGLGACLWVMLKMLGGWLLTAFAMMLGAPFWFDTLCRFVNIRNIGIKPAKAQPGAAK